MVGVITLPDTALTTWLRSRARARRQKRIPRPKLPTKAERRYLGAMVLFAQDFERLVMSWVLDQYPALRLDALRIGPLQLGTVRRRIGPVKIALNQRALQVPLPQIGQAVVDHVTTEATRVIGLKASDVLPMGHTVDAWRVENVKLIRNMSDEMLDRVADTLETFDGARVEEIRDELQATFGVTRARAALIARDQILKLNAQLTEDVHRDAGINEYTWSTSNDGAVRPRHAELGGHRFKYTDPPIVDEKTGRRANPGQDFQCRCLSIPILPELDESVL